MEQENRRRPSRLLILRPHPWTWHPRVSGGVRPAVPALPQQARGGIRTEREHSVRVEPRASGCWRDFLPRP